MNIAAFARRSRLIVAICLGASMAACGGSPPEDDGVQVSELSIEARDAFSGDWPENRMYYSIDNETELQRAWAERVVNIDCAKSFNGSACDPHRQPVVDFSRYKLAGVYLGRNWQFRDSSRPVVVTSNADGVTVEFQVAYVESSSNPSTAPPMSYFFLLPSRIGSVTFQPI